MPNLLQELNLDASFLANTTSAVQLGFVLGTLVFAVLAIADRYKPSRVFFISAILAAIVNLGINLQQLTGREIILIRFCTGFFLAGIYPVGMKIAADHFKEKLGKSLGYLVGALVLGTALPHFIKNYTFQLPWQTVLMTTSFLSVIGGTAMLVIVPSGQSRITAQKMKFTAFLDGFQNPYFRASALGYFGHMWELYTFWAFVPIMLATYNSINLTDINIPLFSFLIIAIGAPACMISGWLSQTIGAKKLARFALFQSSICCLVSPFFMNNESPVAFLFFLFCWSFFVIADSPMFSSLVAKNAPESSRGSALTIVNCIGFTITIISIQIIQWLSYRINHQFLYLTLAIGPILGLLAFSRYREIE
jgi:MFS family permease